MLAHKVFYLRLVESIIQLGGGGSEKANSLPRCNPCILLGRIVFEGIPFEVSQGYNGLAEAFVTTLTGGVYMSNTKWYQTPVHVLVALALALLAGIPFMPQAAASPDQATFYSSASDGYLEAIGTNYSAVHDSSAGSLGAPEALFVGQIGPNVFYDFRIARCALSFNTSSLPDDACITSATLSLYGYYDWSHTNFLITVVDGSLLHETLVPDDYRTLKDQTVSGGSFDTTDFNFIGYNDIPLNETGMGWISKTGITKFGLRSSRDIAPTVPTGWEEVQIMPSEAAHGIGPKLVVTYTTPVGGEAYRIDKTSVLAPWSGLALIAILATGAAVLAVRRRRPA